MARYIATENTPGYLPQNDEPAVFSNPADAWAYLADERRDAEDGEDGEGDYSDVVNELDAYASAEHGPGTVYGPTPGYDGRHDLGVAYIVTQVERVSGRCPCCGDDVAVLDSGYACDDCTTEGCEEREDAVGEAAYWECQRMDSVSATEAMEAEDDGRRYSCADCGRTDVRARERVRTHGGFVCTACQEREGYAALSD